MVTEAILTVVGSALIPLLQGATRDLAAGFYYWGKHWLGGQDYCVDVRLMRLVDSQGGYNFGSCQIKRIGWFVTQIKFTGTSSLLLSNREFKRFHKVLDETYRPDPNLPRAG